jgi:large subunit ribosomal protein L15
MRLNQLADNEGSRKFRMRVGRGIGSGKGKTSGRGVKGQKARTGVSIKGFEGGQMPIHRRLPKRGFNPLNRLEFAPVNLGAVQKAIEAGRIDAGQAITSDVLRAAGLADRRMPVRLLAKGTLTSKASFAVDAASAAAAAQVEKLGGTVTLPAVEAPAEPKAKKEKKK